MRKRFVLCFAVCLAALFLCVGCNHSIAGDGKIKSVSYEKTCFIYNGSNYEITERQPLVNAINGTETMGTYVIIEGHISPDNSYYGIFDMDGEKFVADLIGNNLIHINDSIESILYAFDGDIYTYSGEKLASCELGENEFIDSLTYDANESEICVEIQTANGESRITTIPYEMK